MTITIACDADGDSESAALLLPGAAKVPRDSFQFAYIVYVVLGVGTLIPWNAFISAVDYFTYLYPDVSTARVFSVVYLLLMLVVLTLVVVFAHTSNAFVRINVGFGLFLVSLVAAPLIDDWYVKGRVGVYGGYYATLFVIVLCGIGDGLVQGSVVGTAGELPERYMQACFVGTAVSGVLVAVLRIVTKAMYPQNGSGLRQSANLYFIVSFILMLLNVVLFNLVHKLPVIKHYTNLRRTAVNEERKQKGDLTGKQWRLTLVDIVGAVKWHGSGILIIYIVTLSIFPGSVTEDVHSVALKDWYPILLIAGFNVFDLIGKSLTSLYIMENASAAIAASFARLLFWPIFYGCLNGPKVFRTEIPIMVLTCLLGLTNGYFTSVLMILAPKTVRLQHAEAAGIVLVLYLAVGLATGSIISWFWVL